MSTAKITVLARIHAKPEYAAQIQEWALTRLIPATRAEPGCLQYDFHSSKDDPTLFVFFENFKDMAAFESHAQAPYVTEFLEAMKTMTRDGGVKVDLLEHLA
ncbi:putative quinol monooxygenase [Kamptonema cortianum]|nr:putative quinol monooxygenase [Oscillatoria laete-virens]MDK3159624.1 putative quinol monooxygenase [Kamptonema cortianum]MDL5050273.1 putative quinol monooxygenase [Oscillatoria amoena NRMC-F 0135]MDL5055108.1 putative quinol monooxygenase [Oscillatoria laete-virens NRMC-F 0139]